MIEHPTSHSFWTTVRQHRGLLRWLAAAVFATLLIATSVSWQSWERNTALHSVSSFPLYFLAIWVGYLTWIGIAVLIYRWHTAIPMFSHKQPYWWLIHALLSVLIGFVHQAIDTLLLWLSLSQSFTLISGFLEKLIRWMPYEMLAYWTCLCAMTLITHRSTLLAADAPAYLSRLAVKDGDETKLIQINDVDYIEAYDNYVKVWRHGERLLLRDTMSTLEKSLDPYCFARIHRSYIVNLKSVAAIAPASENAATEVVLRSGERLPISRRRKANLKARLHRK